MVEKVGIFIALAAGAVSFFSPCILPIIPSYLSFIGGSAVAPRRRVILRTIFFVAGFSLTFVVLGFAFSSAGLLLAGISRIVDLIAGAVVILFGFHVIFDFWNVLNIECRLRLSRRPQGGLGSLFVGMAFGAGWTPCVGPVLASILLLAGTSGSMTRGAALLAAYSVGLGCPFVLAGVFCDKFLEHLQLIRSHMLRMRTATGTFLVLLGLLIAVGGISRLNGFLFGIAAALESFQRTKPWVPRVLSGFLFLVVGAVAALVSTRKLGLTWRVFRPFAFVVFAISLCASVLSFAGIIDFGTLLTAWLRFQGI